MTLTAYKVGIGWNLDPVTGCTVLVPQPATPNGVQQAARIPSAGGKFYPEGERFVDLTYTMLEDNAERNALDAQFGVTITTVSNKVTLVVRDDDGVYRAYNAWVEYPETGRKAARWGQGWRNVIYTAHLVGGSL